MITKRKNKRPFSERGDVERIESNWKKVQGLLDRQEWSSAIIRAATASEIAANLVVREELQVKRQLEKGFVDSLLLWANGIQGKFDRLILPVTKGTQNHKKFMKVKAKVTEINRERNLIVHSGQFKKQTTAEKVANEAREVIEALVSEYRPGFRLETVKTHLTSPSRRRDKPRG